LRDHRHRSGGKTLVQRAKSGDLDVRPQATWGMSVDAVAIEDWDENVVPACYYKLIGPMHRSLYVYLFFDTETTGVNKSSDRVIQLAWLLATESGKELRRQNLLIKPSGFEIPTAAEKIHGISTAVASRFGVPLRQALLEFANDVENCQVLVAHNLSFDLGMLRPEFGREGIRWRLDEKSMICTMRISTNWCRLSKLDGRPGYKWPKLDELHYRLFGKYFENAHDALNDVVATRNCFFELKKQNIITQSDMPKIQAASTKISEKTLTRIVISKSREEKLSTGSNVENRAVTARPLVSDTFQDVFGWDWSAPSSDDTRVLTCPSCSSHCQHRINLRKQSALCLTCLSKYKL
jgi:DNA polymerase III epsilon subunit-like protein